MKKVTHFSARLIALLLAAAMLFSLAACGNTLQQAETAPQKQEQQEAVVLEQDADDEALSLEQLEALPQEEQDRESLEQIVELLGDGQNVEDMTDEQLGKLAEELLGQLEKEEEQKKPASEPAAQEKPAQSEEAPIVDMDENAYGDDGAMNTPFDQVYPELIENGAVEYDDESLLIKLDNDHGSAVTEGLKAAGVAALEAIVPMSSQTWYEAKLVAGTDAKAALEAVRALDEVQLAEYNYQIQTSAIDDYKHFDKELDDEFKKNGHNKDQWHFHHCGIPDGYAEMETKGGSSGVVVAVIDTGVDIDHEDLAQNIWKNANEVPNNNIDDDGNGYVDDYYGVNIVAGKGNGDDDNGHGTHVAGIVAAQNNNLGVVGIAYNVKIMPVKAAMASGYLHQSDIAKAVLYAYEMGADVINMSFGGSANTIAVQDALMTAYTRCVLVASAGNEGISNERLPNYPGALTYVLGVMSVDQNGVESTFTNYDQNAYNNIEYELYAPGDSIMSTLPDNRYGYLSGTSMAAPVVSAMAAILRSEYADRETYPTKFIYGQLSSTSEYHATCLDPQQHGEHNLPQIVNLYSALSESPNPEVGVQEFTLFDTAGIAQDENGFNNGDGVIDSGETIALGFTLRNRWGKSKDTVVSIDALSTTGIPDPYIDILNPDVDYGSVGTYSTQDAGRIDADGLHTGWENPFYVRIAKDCPNDYIFTLHVNVACKNALNEEDTSVYRSQTYNLKLTVRNGVVLPSVIREDMVLTADNLYIIPNATTIREGVTVRVEPGTHIQFWSNDPNDAYADSYIAYLRVEGRFLVEGTKEEPVYIYPSDLMAAYVVDFGEAYNGHINLEYVDITNFNKKFNASGTHGVSYAKKCIFRTNSSSMLCRLLSDGVVSDVECTESNFGTWRQMEDCVFYKIGAAGFFKSEIIGKANRCIFVDSAFSINDLDLQAENCVFLGNSFITENQNQINSAYSLYNAPADIDNIEINTFYCEETGSTYITLLHAYGDYWNLRDSSEEIEMYADALGGGYAVIETKEELCWIEENIKFSTGCDNMLYLGITYSPLHDTYTWTDGTVVETIEATEEFVENHPILLYDGQLVYNNDSHPGHSDSCKQHKVCALLEIPGQIYVKDLKLTEYEIQLDMDTTYQLIVSADPVVDTRDLIFESTNEAVATVDEGGLIKPISKGTADIYVYSHDKAVSNYITVSVVDCVPLQSVLISVDKAELAIGKTMPIYYSLAPADTTRRNVRYASSDPSVAHVDQYGKVTGLSSGKTVISVVTEETDAEGKLICDSVELTVYHETTSLTLDKSAQTAYLAQGSVELPRVNIDDGAETNLIWYTLDPEVAVVENSKLILKKCGITTLIVKDTLSNLMAECEIFVQESDNQSIKKIRRFADRRAFVLMENNDLYFWDVNRQRPLVIATDVADFDENGAILRTDGTVEFLDLNNLVVESKVDTFTGKNIKEFASNVSSSFVVLEDGRTFAWGSNYNGMLGIGTKETASTPMLVNLDDVVDISINYLTTFFLTATGNLYIAGTDEGIVNPTLIAEGVDSLIPNDLDYVCFKFKSGQYGFADLGGIIYYSSIDASEMDIFSYALDYNESIGIKDGMVYLFKPENPEPILIPGITNAVNVLSSYSTHYIVTEDNLLYGFGVNEYNALAGMTKINPVSEPIPIILDTFDGEIYLVESNLTAENSLCEDTLVLSFNRALQTVGTMYLYADDSQVTFLNDVEDQNQLVISRHKGFEENVTYQLIIAAGSLNAAAGMTNEDVITLTFTYEPEETECLDMVVREAIMDTSVERFYWSPENFIQKIQQLRSERNWNTNFVGNVILNRVFTDDSVDHWMRFIPNTGDAYTQFPMGGNYWGTTNETAIGLQIVDYTDFPNYGEVIYTPYLTEAPENTFPFVTRVTVLNKNGVPVTNVSNEEITVRVNFNRDMDTSIPLQVRFGSAFPYGDYEITEGSYVDARTWEGKYTLNTIIENGYQYFTISNGCSATDDLELYTDQMRFMFEIDTSAAQALIMQGTATDTGINLTWTQDDFDTLMGYNVYRATSEDGLYTRLNSTVIPADTMEFFDATVEPGVRYYYNFTVVKTDLTESTPSGKITIMSKDTMAPDIYPAAAGNATAGMNYVISATVTDNLHVVYTDLHYRMGDSGEWKTVRMNKLNDKYSAVIPGTEMAVGTLQYYFEAFDGVSATCKGSESEPYTVTVREAVDANSLGDVNGDGKITNLDALMLLQAINDLYNMSDEQFARADLDGNGILEAKEALRILQYVSGKVGSVVMQ